MLWAGSVWAWGCPKPYYLVISDYWGSVRVHFLLFWGLGWGRGGWPYWPFAVLCCGPGPGPALALVRPGPLPERLEIVRKLTKIDPNLALGMSIFRVQISWRVFVKSKGPGPGPWCRAETASWAP